MAEFKDKWFTGRVEGANLDNHVLRNCTFDGCFLVRAPRPGQWRRIANVEVHDATQINCSLDTAALENVTLHNLKRGGDSPLFLWSCVFKHVRLSGRLSGIKINRATGVGRGLAEGQEEWDRAVRSFYRDVDWALDISDARFAGGVSFEAIPGNLIRRDPSKQVLVRRDQLARQDWRSMDFEGTAIDLDLSGFETGSVFDSVVIAARSDPKWVKRDLSVLQRLRDVGLAEPD